MGRREGGGRGEDGRERGGNRNGGRRRVRVVGREKGERR